MAICSACQKDFIPETIIEKAALELLSPRIELYDFGGGHKIAPFPDFPGTPTNLLASHFSALVEVHAEDGKISLEKSKWLPFKIANATYQKSSADFSGGIIDDLKRAIENWPTKAIPLGKLDLASIL